MENVYEYGEMKFVEQEFPMESERDWLEDEPGKALSDAVVLRPVGHELSEKAINTIRHFRYYLNGEDGMVLLSDTVIAKVETDTIGSMIEAALEEASTVTGSMPDFAPYDMDDGCGMLHMCNANVFGFSESRLTEDARGSLTFALEARAECLAACEACEIVAVVYNDRADFEIDLRPKDYFSKWVEQIRMGFAEELKIAATGNDPLAELAGIDGRDAESMKASYTKQAERYVAALGRLFRDRTSCEVCYMTLCLLNAIREADFFDLELEPVTRDIAHRTLDAAKFAFTTYSEAYDAIRDMLVQGTPADLVMQGIDAMMEKVLAVPEEHRAEAMAAYLELAIISCMICIDRDWDNDVWIDDTRMITWHWYRTFYRTPTDPVRIALREKPAE